MYDNFGDMSTLTRHSPATFLHFGAGVLLRRSVAALRGPKHQDHALLQRGGAGNLTVNSDRQFDCQFDCQECTMLIMSVSYAVVFPKN